MRQFIFANSVYSSSNIGNAPYNSITVGTVIDGHYEVGFSDGHVNKWNKSTSLIYVRKKEDGGNVIIPISFENFSCTLGSTSNATKFSAKIVITDDNVSDIGDYSIIIVKKGKKFNERNKWTITYHCTDINETKESLAVKLTDLINGKDSKNNVITPNHGVTATNLSNTITITGNTAGEDYEIVLADNLYGTLISQTHAKFGVYDKEFIKDLAEKAAADAGFEYTYKEAGEYLYPNLPLNMDTVVSNTTQYDVLTLRFAESRNVKTRDELINQIVQIVAPKGTLSIMVNMLNTLLNYYNN